MILEIFKDSFEYSSKNWKTIFKLGIIYILGQLLFFPIFFFEGYSYRVTSIGVKGMINGKDPLPKFNNWGKMFIEGLKIFFVNFIYSLPGTIALFLITSTSLSTTYSTVFQEGATAQLINPSLFGILWGILAIPIILWLICYWISTVATVHMINNDGSLKSAFNIKEIIEIIRSIGIFKYIEFYIGYIVIIIGLLATSFLLILLFSSVIGIITIIIFSNYDIGIITTGILTISIFIFMSIFVLVPFFNVFESRAKALIYNMRNNY